MVLYCWSDGADWIPFCFAQDRFGSKGRARYRDESGPRVVESGLVLQSVIPPETNVFFAAVRHEFPLLAVMDDGESFQCKGQGTTIIVLEGQRAVRAQSGHLRLKY